MAGCRIPCCWRSSPTPASAPWSSRMERADERDTAAGAERLLALLAAAGRVCFTNSGTEANEAALKLVRRHQGPSRPVIVAADGGFHGRTMGSLALTGKEAIRQPFGPFGVEARFVPYGDAAALAGAVGPDCAAVFIEPCQGEAGVVPAPAGYLSAARRACDPPGALLVIAGIPSGVRGPGPRCPAPAARPVPARAP